MDSIVENQTNLKTLTEGIHSKEALELVREHVLGVMGPASMAYSNTMIKMAKLQVCMFALAELFGVGVASTRRMTLLVSTSKWHISRNVLHSFCIIHCHWRATSLLS